jgi:general stress protein YciG
MAFKMNGSPAKMGTIRGTAGHSSALKMRVEQKAASALKQLTDEAEQKANEEKTAKSRTKEKSSNIGKKGLYASDMSWKEGTAKAKSEGHDLNALTKQRKKLKKGSFEYNKVQNKINSALGNKKRYDEGPAAEPTKVKPTKLEKATKKNVKVKAEADENLDKRTAQLSKREARKKFGKGSKEHLEAKAVHLAAKESDRQGEKGGRKQGIFRKASSRINIKRQERTKAKLAKFGEVEGEDTPLNQGLKHFTTAERHG